MLILSVYLTNVKPTDSSASWFSSLKNAERHKFFQKSQFCFFSFSSLIIHCKTLSQSYFIRKVDTAFTKLSSLRITNIALSFTILCTQFTIVNFITNLFQDFLSTKLHDYHSFCDHCQFRAIISCFSVEHITFVAWSAFIVILTAVFWRRTRWELCALSFFFTQNFQKAWIFEKTQTLQVSVNF